MDPYEAIEGGTVDGIRWAVAYDPAVWDLGSPRDDCPLGTFYTENDYYRDTAATIPGCDWPTFVREHRFAGDTVIPVYAYADGTGYASAYPVPIDAANGALAVTRAELEAEYGTATRTIRRTARRYMTGDLRS